MMCTLLGIKPYLHTMATYDRLRLKRGLHDCEKVLTCIGGIWGTASSMPLHNYVPISWGEACVTDLLQLGEADIEYMREG